MQCCFFILYNAHFFLLLPATVIQKIPRDSHQFNQYVWYCPKKYVSFIENTREICRKQFRHLCHVSYNILVYIILSPESYSLGTYTEI